MQIGRFLFTTFTKFSDSVRSHKNPSVRGDAIQNVAHNGFYKRRHEYQRPTVSLRLYSRSGKEPERNKKERKKLEKWPARISFPLASSLQDENRRLNGREDERSDRVIIRRVYSRNLHPDFEVIRFQSPLSFPTFSFHLYAGSGAQLKNQFRISKYANFVCNVDPIHSRGITQLVCRGELELLEAQQIDILLRYRLLFGNNPFELLDLYLIA